MKKKKKKKEEKPKPKKLLLLLFVELAGFYSNVVGSGHLVCGLRPPWQVSGESLCCPCLALGNLTESLQVRSPSNLLVMGGGRGGCP